MTDDAARPVGKQDFAALMDGLGPFEDGPVLAVGVSGGADSLALCLLAREWAADRGGRVEALTVDHALRPESGDEAATVGRWLADRDLSHHILTWQGEKPATGIQAAAREARFRLLRSWCRDHGVLHLLLAHHLDDQAETFLLRLGRGSGVDGLSAMAPVTALPEVRLLRPLLDIPRARLAATLRALGQPWIEDPSNQSDHYRRVRFRKMMPLLAAEGLDPARLAGTARHLAAARHALEVAATDLALKAVEVDPAGFAWLDCGPLAAAPREVGLRTLSRLVRMIGGGAYPPRLDGLERLFDGLLASPEKRRTFAGCLLGPWKDRLLVCREGRGLAEPVPVRGGDSVLWDGRFLCRIEGTGTGTVGALGADGWRTLREAVGVSPVPAPVLATLPALVDPRGISAVPHLGYTRRDGVGLRMGRTIFQPVNPLSPV